jgi:hypothetical protein
LQGAVCGQLPKSVPLGVTYSEPPKPNPLAPDTPDGATASIPAASTPIGNAARHDRRIIAPKDIPPPFKFAGH